MRFAPTALALLHAVTPVPRTPPPSSALSPLYNFESDTASEALTAWERIDDVIMGGVSSSRLTLSPEGGCALFEGRLRSEGGGFCGQRMRLLAEPIDLSGADGVFIDCEALPIGAAPSKRVWKMAIRTKQDRGEVVYQAAFDVDTKRKVVRLPYSAFRLVRGPRLMPGVPPLSASQVNETYQMSIVVSKFEVSETGSALADFEEGLFALRLFAVGTFVESLASGPTPTLPRALTEEEQKAAAPAMIKLLRPLLGVFFSEAARRRKAATKLLTARGSSRFQRAKLGWAWRASGGGPLVAVRKTAAVALRDFGGLALSIPVRLLFKAIVLLSRAIKTMKRVTSRAGGADTPAAAAA